jgi:hypothetical protein
LLLAKLRKREVVCRKKLKNISLDAIGEIPVEIFSQIRQFFDFQRQISFGFNRARLA